MLGRIDDRWETSDSGYDPCDPRFDSKEIALHLHSPGVRGAILFKATPHWKELVESEHPPIGILSVADLETPTNVSGHPPVSCDVWLETAALDACEAVTTARHKALEGSVEIALRPEDLLEGARNSAMRFRYLRDVNIGETRSFPVASLTIADNRERER
jgi:hypothetical protein